MALHKLAAIDVIISMGINQTRTRYVQSQRIRGQLCNGIMEFVQGTM